LINKIINVMQKKCRELHSQHAIHESVRFGILLAIVGGFLDAYTFVGRGGVFANAQTGNIVLLGIYASEGEWRQALVHVPPILACVIGVIVVESIKKISSRLSILDWAQAVLIIEIIVLFIIGFIPNTVPNIVVTVTVSFVASIQVSSFRKLVDSPYTTTMSTGNLRSASQAVYIAITQRDKESGIRAIRYFAIILSFLLGAFLGGLLTLIIGVKSIWGAVIVLVIAVILFSIQERKDKAYESA
jgi:uncharacterized membrane protein YoaK (UPF0700 family)